MESIYDQMNKIDDKESLNEKYNVRTLKDVSRLTESVNNITEDQLRAIFATWNDTVGYGFITIGTNAVRYTSEELDLQQYVKMSDLVNAVNADAELTLESISEDPMTLTDYFTDTCGVSHYFEIEEFIEKSTELNIKYFGVEIVDEVDTDLRSTAKSSYDEFDESVSLTESPIGSNDGSELSTTHDAKVVYETVRHIVDNKDSEEYPNSETEAINHVKRNLKVDIEKNAVHWGYNNVSIKQLVSNYTKAIKLIEDNFEGVTKDVAQLRDLLKQLQDKYNQNRR